MVLVFGILYFLDPAQVEAVPNFIVPLCGTVILMGSGIYQFMHRWPVSPITWIGGTLMLLLTLINFTVNPDQNFYGITLLVFAGVIGFGVITGET
jgi:hypothetical protein